MSEKWKLPAPIVVVAIIALCSVGFLLWPSITRQDDADDTPSQQAPLTKNVGVSPAAETSEEAGDSDAPIPALPNVEVEYADAAWSTYHGGPALTGAVKAVLPEAPVVLWRFQADSPVYHTPVSCGERIYFTTTKGGVFALDLEGNEIWSKHPVRGTKRDGTPRMERFDAPTACFDGTVLVGAMSGTLYAFDAATGAQKWTYDVGGPILGTVNIHRSAESGGADRVYVIGQNDGTLHGIELESGTRSWKAEAIDRCDGSPSVGGDAIIFGSCAAALHVFSAQDGKLIKNIPIDDDSQIAGGVAIVGDSVFSGSHSGYLIHANSKTGEVVWINKDSEDEVLSTPAVSGEWVVFTSYDGLVYGLDRTTGQKRWSFDTEGWPTSPVIAAGKVILSADGVLYLLRLDTGEKIWSYEVSDETTSPAIIRGMIVVGSEDGTITAFGPSQG